MPRYRERKGADLIIGNTAKEWIGVTKILGQSKQDNIHLVVS